MDGKNDSIDPDVILNEDSTNNMPRSPSSNQLVRDARREQILTAATGLFATKGLAATRVSDVAGAAGVAQGLVYHYFASKEAVYDELVSRSMERLVAAANALAALPVPPREKIRMALERILADIAASGTVAQTYLLTAQAGEAAAPARTRRRQIAQRNLPYEIVAGIFKAGQQDGSVRPFDAGQMATLFWAAVKGLALHRVTFGKGATMPDPSILMAAFFGEGPAR